MGLEELGLEEELESEEPLAAWLTESRPARESIRLACGN